MIEPMMLPAINSARISEFVQSGIGFPPPGIVLGFVGFRRFVSRCLLEKASDA